MAYAVQVLDDRHPGLGADALYQALAAAGHDDIHVFRHGDQFAHRRAVGRCHYLHRRLGQAGLPQSLGQALGDGPVRSQGLGTTPQDGGVARFQAQARRLHRHVGARFVDDTDNPQRHPHATHLDAAGHGVHIADRTHRVRERGHLAQALQHVVDACRGQLQTVQQGRGQAVVRPARHVLGIGCGQFRPGAIQRIPRRQQGPVAGCGSGGGHMARGGASGLPQFDHILVYIHRERTLSIAGKTAIIPEAPAPCAKLRG